MIAPEITTAEAVVGRRPWAALARELEPEPGAWSEYSAWQTWLDGALDAMACGTFQPGPIRDMLDGLDTEIGLYVLMCKLADGAPMDTPSPAVPIPGRTSFLAGDDR